MVWAGVPVLRGAVTKGGFVKTSALPRLRQGEIRAGRLDTVSPNDSGCARGARPCL